MTQYPVLEQKTRTTAPSPKTATAAMLSQQTEFQAYSMRAVTVLLIEFTFFNMWFQEISAPAPTKGNGNSGGMRSNQTNPLWVVSRYFLEHHKVGMIPILQSVAGL